MREVVLLLLGGIVLQVKGVGRLGQQLLRAFLGVVVVGV
jgi:hypothetical protein